MSLINKQWHRVSRPSGEASPTTSAWSRRWCPSLQDGQLLVRHHYLSCRSVHARGRMNEGKSYAAAQPLNEVMQGGTVGEVAASKSDAYRVGDRAVGMGGCAVLWSTARSAACCARCGR